MFTWKNCQIFIEANCFVELSNKIPRSVVDHCYWSNEAKWETSFNTPAKHPFFRQKRALHFFYPYSSLVVIMCSIISSMYHSLFERVYEIANDFMLLMKILMNALIQFLEQEQCKK